MPPKPQRRQQQQPDEAAISRGLVALLAAEGDNPAAAAGPRRFKMTLYTGETVSRYNWMTDQTEHIVLDVAGFKPKRDGGWPAMVDHWQRAGTIDAATADTAAVTITATGRFLANDDRQFFPAAERAQAILSQGHALQCSGYWVPVKVERVEGGAKASVNGQTVTGPIQIWREFNMREGSFTDLGRDEMTQVELAASLAAGAPQPMSEKPTKETKPMSANFSLLASLAKFVGADKALDLAAKQPDAADLAAFLPAIEAEFTDLRAKLDKANADLAARDGDITKLKADLAAAQAAPPVKLAIAGDPANPPEPGGKSDADLKAAFEASADLRAEFGTFEVFKTAHQRNLVATPTK